MRAILAIVFAAIQALAQQPRPSLGDLARQERERRENGPKAARKMTDQDSAGKPEMSVPDGYVEIRHPQAGVRLAAPKECKVNDYAPKSGTFEIRCSSGTLNVSSERVADGKISFGEGEARLLELRNRLPNVVASRNLQISGHAAYEFVSQDEATRSRIVLVLVPGSEVGAPGVRMYTFRGSEKAASSPVVLETILQSFVPLPISQAQPGQQNRRTFSAEEVIAIEYVRELARLQYRECKTQLHRFCATLDEVIALVQQRGDRPLPAHQDPRFDPAYTYRFQVTGEECETSATPKQPGFGGFLATERNVFYNPRGTASRQDEMITGPGKVP